MKKETIYQNFWDTAKAVLRRESTAINAFQGEKKISNKQPKFIPQETRSTTN